MLGRGKVLTPGPLGPANDKPYPKIVQNRRLKNVSLVLDLCTCYQWWMVF